MGAYDNRTSHHGSKIHKVVFHRVAVDGGYSGRCRPLMMCLVNVFVETRVVEEPVKERGRKGRRREKRRERRSRRERGGERGWEGRVEEGRGKSRSKFVMFGSV